jgi:hypothetical protein
MDRMVVTIYFVCEKCGEAYPCAGHIDLTCRCGGHLERKVQKIPKEIADRFQLPFMQISEAERRGFYRRSP